MAIWLAVLLIFTQGKASPDHWIGMWKLNPAKSHYQAGSVPKSRTLTFIAIPGGMKAMSDLLDNVGIVHIEFEAQYGGPDVPMRGGPAGPTIAVKRINSYTFETYQKSGQTVTATTHFVVSGDTKMLTGTATGVDSNGHKYTNVSVYDRQ